MFRHTMILCLFSLSQTEGEALWNTLYEYKLLQLCMCLTLYDRLLIACVLYSKYSYISFLFITARNKTLNIAVFK